jgi:hypothetical protein
MFAIFQHMIFKFEFLKEDNLRTNIDVGFYDPLLRSPGIEVGLEPFRLNLFHYFTIISLNFNANYTMS